MAVKKKARAFIEKLWLKIAPKYSRASRQKLDSAFANVVTNLPEGKLKKELASDLGAYSALLSKLRQAHCAAEDAAEDSSHFPFNLLLPGEPTIDKSALTSMTDSVKLQTASLLVSKASHRLGVTNSAYDLLLASASQAGAARGKTGQPADADQVQERHGGTAGGALRQHEVVLQRLLASLSVAGDAMSVRKIISAFLKHLQPAVDDTLPLRADSSKEQSLSELLRIVRSFLILVQVKNVDKLAPKIPQYDDLLAAMLSCYVDLDVCVSCARARRADGTAEDDTAAAATARAAGAQLAGRVLYLLRHRSPLLALDVLLQLARPPSGGGFVGSHSPDLTRQALLPLYRKLLLASTPGLQLAANPCDGYAKYVAAIKLVMTLFGDDAADLAEAARKVPAPTAFMKWLERADLALLDELPTEKRFSGVRITRFLIDESETSLCEQILQLTYRDQPLCPELLLDGAGPLLLPAAPAMFACIGEQSTEVVDPKVDEATVDEEQLFFIDTKCNESVRRKLGGVGAGLSGPRAQRADDGALLQASTVGSLGSEIALLDQEMASDDDAPLQPIAMSLDAADLEPEMTEAALSQISWHNSTDAEVLVVEGSSTPAEGSCATAARAASRGTSDLVAAEKFPAKGLRRGKAAESKMAAKKACDQQQVDKDTGNRHSAANEEALDGDNGLSSATTGTESAAVAWRPTRKRTSAAAVEVVATCARAVAAGSKVARRGCIASAAGGTASEPADDEQDGSANGESAGGSADGADDELLPPLAAAEPVSLLRGKQGQDGGRREDVGGVGACSEQKAPPDADEPASMATRARSDSESSACSSYSLRRSARASPMPKPPILATPTRRSRRLSSASSITSDDEGDGDVIAASVARVPFARQLASAPPRSVAKKGEKRTAAGAGAATLSAAARVLSPLAEDDDNSEAAAAASSASDAGTPKKKLTADRLPAKKRSEARAAPSYKTPAKRVPASDDQQDEQPPASAQKKKSHSAAEASPAFDLEILSSSQVTRYSLRCRATPSAAEHL